MLLNKSIVILVFILKGIIIYSQPGSSKTYLNYKISFIKKNGNKISFKKKDSITLKSCKGNLSFTLNDIVYSKNNKDSLAFNRMMSNNFYKLGNTESTYTFNEKNNVFSIKSLIRTSYNDFLISKSVPVLIINKKTKTMIVRFNFNNVNQDLYLDELPLVFKEGVYEVTDNKSCKLIKVSDK